MNNNLSWHLNQPWVNDVLQPDRVCDMVPPSPHNLHIESYCTPHLCSRRFRCRRLLSAECSKVRPCPGSLCPLLKKLSSLLPPGSSLLPESWLFSHLGLSLPTALKINLPLLMAVLHCQAATSALA